MTFALLISYFQYGDQAVILHIYFLMLLFNKFNSAYFEYECVCVPAYVGVIFLCYATTSQHHVSVGTHQHKHTYIGRCSLWACVVIRCVLFALY